MFPWFFDIAIYQKRKVPPIPNLILPDLSHTTPHNSPSTQPNMTLYYKKYKMNRWNFDNKRGPYGLSPKSPPPPYARKSASKAVLSWTQLIPHATR